MRRGTSFTGNSAPLGGPITPPRRAGSVAPNPSAPFGAQQPMALADFTPPTNQAVWSPFLYRPWAQAFVNLVANETALILAEPDDTRVGFLIRNSRTSGATIGLGFNVVPDTTDFCFAELGPGEVLDASQLGAIPQNRIYVIAFGGAAKVVVAWSDIKGAA